MNILHYYSKFVRGITTLSLRFQNQLVCYTKTIFVYSTLYNITASFELVTASGSVALCITYGRSKMLESLES